MSDSGVDAVIHQDMDFGPKLQRAFDERLNATADSKNRGCLVAPEKRRSSACMCIFDLATSHREILSDSFTTFLLDLSGLPADKRRSFAQSFAYNPDRACTSLNSPLTKDFTLPVKAGDASQTITVCRNSMITITRRCLGYPWKDTFTIFAHQGETSSRPMKRKIAVMEILKYLLNQHYPEHTNVDWKHEDFVKLRYNINTTKKYVQKYQLRELSNTAVVSAVHHAQWLRTHFRAVVVKLDEPTTTDALSVICQRGVVAAGYKSTELHPPTFHASSMDEDDDDIIFTESVQRRPIRFPENTRDMSAVVAMECLKSPLATALGCAPAQLSFKAWYAKSMRHQPQPPLTDLDPTVATIEKTRGKAHIAITPLTDSGCYQQLWSPEKKGEPGALIFIRHGCSLLLPPDAIRAGGFLSNPTTQDLSLEMVVLQDAKTNVIQHQLYQPSGDFPNSVHLTDEGRLTNAFNSDLAAPI